MDNLKSLLVTACRVLANEGVTSYTKDNGYLAVIMGVFGVFRPSMQLNDALIAS